MRFTTEEEQKRMLVLGNRIVELASAETRVHAPRQVTVAEMVMNTADAATQALVGHYTADGEKLGNAVYGIGVAIGSLMAQCSEPDRRQVLAALQHGLLRGSHDTARASGPVGRA